MRFHVITGILILLLAGDLALAADAFVAAVQDAVVPARETATGAADTKDKPQDGDKKSTDGKDKGKEKEKEKDKGKGKEKEKGKEKDKEKDKDKPPACMHCGATCGLEAVCVCECGTKKKPKTEYEAMRRRGESRLLRWAGRGGRLVAAVAPVAAGLRSPVRPRLNRPTVASFCRPSGWIRPLDGPSGPVRLYLFSK
jgi:hypothetical protein